MLKISKYHLFSKFTFLLIFLYEWSIDFDIFVHYFIIFLFYCLSHVLSTGTWILSSWIRYSWWSKIDVFLRNVLWENSFLFLWMKESVWYLCLSILNSNNGCFQFFGNLVHERFFIDFMKIVLFKSSPSLFDLWS